MTNCLGRSGTSLTVCAVLFLFGGASRAHAQDVQALEARIATMQTGYETRLAAMEAEIQRLKSVAVSPLATAAPEELERAISGVALPGMMGRLDQTTRFSNRFNPAISVVGDFVLSVSGRENSYENDNQFRLRAVELGLAGRVDPHVSYVATIVALEDLVELEEAFADWDNGLPDTFTLRAGHMPVDFGKAAPQHDHELAFVDKPAALQEYLAGRPTTTGVALHHWFGLGDVPVRWSVGVGNRLDGDAHAIQGPMAGAHENGAGATGAEPFGKRGTGDFVWSARVTSSIELGAHSDLQLGTSVVFAPRERVFFFTDPPTNTLVDSSASDRSVAGVDAFFRYSDPAQDSAFTIGGEWLWSRMQSVDTAATPPAFANATAHGGYVMAQYAFNRHYSLGARWDYFQHAEDPANHNTGLNLALTWNVNEFNRLRLEGGTIDDGGLGESYAFTMIQWTIILGSHAHALAW